MNNEPILCKKCAHQQFRGTHCDFCGTSLTEKQKPEERMSKFAWLRILGFVAIFAIFFAVSLFFHHKPSTQLAVYPPPVTIFPAQTAGAVNKVMQTAAQSNSDTPTGADIFTKAAPGIVTLYEDNAAGKHQRAIGAGFLVDDTTIATNNHVVHGISTLSAQFNDGTVRKVTGVLGTNTEHDVALLETEKPEAPAGDATIDSLEAVSRQLSATADSTSTHSVTKTTAANGLTMGRSSSLNIGDTVIAAGSPTGLSGSVNQGVFLQMSSGLLKTNMPVDSAWSGGPLLNMQGEVVGMITSQAPSDATGNFALPIEWVASLQAGIGSSPSSSSSHAPGKSLSPSHNFGPYNFKLAAQQKHSLPFASPSDLESAQFSARLTAPAGSHLHLTILRQGHVMYDSGDTAGTRFTVTLKRGDYVVLVENNSKSGTSDVSLAGTFSSDL